MFDVKVYESLIGKTLPTTKMFTEAGDFAAINAARDYLSEQGFSVGTMQDGSPMGIAKGDVMISKWRHLADEHIKMLDGVIVGEYRAGPVTVFHA